MKVDTGCFSHIFQQQNPIEKYYRSTEQHASQKQNPLNVFQPVKCFPWLLFGYLGNKYINFNFNFIWFHFRALQINCKSILVWQNIHIPLRTKKVIQKANMRSHLSKGPTDLKQNSTHEKKLFFGSVFHALSYGVNSFVASVSFKNHQMEASHWLLEHLNRWLGGFRSFATKHITSHERSWKTGSENGIFACVLFCLRSLGPFERCEILSCAST